jgi:CRISPR-associated protein Cmr1
MRRSSQQPATVTAAPTNTVTLRRKITVVTPVHGGGVGGERADDDVQVNKLDPVTPVRTAAIRGQLRFWWRAIHGCRLRSYDEMREREASLWGSAATSDTAGPERATVVAIRLLGKAKVQAEAARELSRGRAYGAFSVAPSGRLVTDGLSRVKGDITVVLTCAEESKREVDDALTAWTLFGGIGGRTRRGFGAIWPEGSPDPEEFLRNLPQDVCTLPLVPSLLGASWAVASDAVNSADEALDLALDRLRLFRQGEVGRNYNGRNPGRSHWPEPDAIRRLTTRNAPRHQPREGPDLFPRAAFGMPIVFQFKNDDVRQGDPPRSTLRPQRSERMASPLILRPVFQAGRWRPAALRLRVPGIENENVILDVQGRHEPLRVIARVDARDLDRILPLHGLHGDGVLERFMDFFSRGPQQRNAPGRNHR